MATVTDTGVSPTLEHPTLEHPIVGNRRIHGEGTPATSWQHWQGLQALPALSLATAFPNNQRVCLFAPHPDDEIAGCGGLLLQLARQGNPITLFSVTNGDKSHPNSTLFPPEKLQHIRPLETQLALATLGIHQQVEHILLGLPDGAVYAEQQTLWHKLSEYLCPNDILVTTFAFDGHPDHEATGQVVQRFAHQHGLACFQVLIWAWHWAEPNDARIAWQQAQRLDLSPTEQQLKQQALRCFASQLYADASTGNAPILPDFALQRMALPWEVFLYDG